MAKYENPAELDYRNGGDTVDDFAQKYMRTVDYVIKALNDLRTPTGNTAGVEPEPYMWRIADNKLYIRNADNTDYVLLGDISPNFGFRQSVNDRFLTTADLEGEGAVVTRNEAGKVEGDITGSPGKIANKTIDVTPSADNDVIAYDAAQQKWVKKTLNDYLKKQGDAGWDEMVDEVADQVIEDITPIIFNFWYLDDDGYLVPLVGSTEGGLPSIHGMVGDYEQITARGVEVAGNLSATGNVTAGMVTTPQANVTTLTANAVNAGTLTADDVIAKGPIIDVRAFGAVGDGVTDDTAAFQNAFLSAANGKSLLVPLGNYKITNNIFAENVKKVYDEGFYVDIKPVYPTEKSIMDGGLNFSHKVVRFPLTASGNTYQAATYDSKRNKIIIGETTSDNSTQYIKIVNPATYEVENTYTYTTLGHINSMEYIADIDKILLGNVVGNKYYLIGDGSAIDTERSVYITGLATCYDDKMKIYLSNSLRNLYVTGYDGTLLKTIDTSTITDTETPWYNNGIIIGNELLYSEAGDANLPPGYAHVFSLNNFEYKGKIRLCDDHQCIEDFFVINGKLYALDEGGGLWEIPMWKSVGVGLTPHPKTSFVKGDICRIRALGFKADNNKYIEVYYQLGGKVINRDVSYRVTSVEHISNVTDGTYISQTTLSALGVTSGEEGVFDAHECNTCVTTWTFDTNNTTSILKGTSKVFTLWLWLEITA